MEKKMTFRKYKFKKIITSVTIAILLLGSQTHSIKAEGTDASEVSDSHTYIDEVDNQELADPEDDLQEEAIEEKTENNNINSEKQDLETTSSSEINTGKTKLAINQQPIVNPDTIEVYPLEGKPGDFITISMEILSDTPLSNINVSFTDLNDINTTISLTYNDNNDRYEGRLLLQDNFREGPIKINLISLSNQHGNVQYHRGDNPNEMELNLSNYDINLIGSHGPYIKEGSFKIDPITHPDKTTGFSFEIVNPQYVGNQFGLGLMARFEGPVKTNSTFHDTYYNTFKIHEDGLVTSTNHYAYEDMKHYDGVYTLRNLQIPILNEDKTNVQYRLTYGNTNDISFEYVNHYTSEPIFDINSISDNNTKIIESNPFTLLFNLRDDIASETNPFIFIEWINENDEVIFSTSSGLDESQSYVTTYNQPMSPGYYTVRRIQQSYDEKYEYVYNSSLYPNSSYNLDALNIEVVALDTVLSENLEKVVNYPTIITNFNESIYKNAFGTGSNEITGSTWDYVSASGIMARYEVQNSFGTWVKIYNNGIEIGWVNKEVLSPLNVFETIDTNYVAKVKKPWSINTAPWGTEGFKFIENADEYIGKEVNVLEEKVTSRSTYALIEFEGEELGWIDKTGIESLSVTAIRDVKYVVEVTRPWSINSTPWGTEGYKTVADGADYIGQHLNVVQEKSTQRSTYMLLQLNGKDIGWIDQTGVRKHQDIHSTRNTQYMAKVVNPWSINTQPWGTSGYKNILSDSSRYLGNTVEVIKEQVTNRSTFAYIKLNGKELGWIDTTALEKQEVLTTKNVNYQAEIVQPWSINSKPWGVEGFTVNYSNASDFMGQPVQVIQEKVTPRSTYALITVDGEELGWMDKDALNLHPVLSTKNVQYKAEITKPWSINSQPWGTNGFKAVVNDASFVGRTVDIIQEKVTPRSTYLLIEENGKEIGWIDTTGVQKYEVLSTRNTNYVATISKPWSINSQPWGVQGYEFVQDGDSLVGSLVTVTQEKVTPRSTYALISVDGEEIGWIDTTGIEKYEILSTRDVSYSITITQPWSINTRPWGVNGFRTVANGGDYLNQTLRVIQEQKTARSTYLLLQLDGRTIGWIDYTGTRRN